jgi:hypothetical protein
VGKAWLPLADQFPLERVNACRAVVVCGGPGYGRRRRRLYPLVPPADQRAPVVFLALGIAVLPGTARQLAEHRFERDDRDFLAWIAARIAFLGARDTLTAELLLRAGFRNVLLTRDPASYDLAGSAKEGTRLPRSTRWPSRRPPIPSTSGRPSSSFDPSWPRAPIGP